MKPILSINDEDYLIELMREQCNLEREVEMTKLQLASRSDFNLFDAFNIFDDKRLGQITNIEIKEGLNGIGVYPTMMPYDSDDED